MTKITRRGALTFLGALGVAATGGLGIGIYSQATEGPYRQWIRSAIRANLPGVRIPDDDMQAFVDEFSARFPLRRVHRVFVLGDGRAYSALQAIRLESESFQELERHVMTQFLFSTDFFDLDDPAVDIVSYYGLSDHRQCFARNPFAEFIGG